MNKIKYCNIVIMVKLSTVNSTTTALGEDGVYTGTAEECLLYSSVTIFIATDVASATNGLSMQLSTDGTNWDRNKNVTFSASDGSQAHALAIVSKYFRIVYTNGSSAQSYLRLQTIFHDDKPRDITSGVTQTVTEKDDVSLTRSIIVSKDPNGDYNNVESSADKGLKVSITDKTPFGDIRVAEATPQVQHIFSYHINTNFVDVLYNGDTNNQGITYENNLMKVRTGTNTGARNIVRTRDHVRYMVGTGVVIRFTMLFSGQSDSSCQILAGFGDSSNGYYFAHKDGGFGVLTRRSGVKEIRTMQLTATTNNNITVTLKGNTTGRIALSSTNVRTSALEIYQDEANNRTFSELGDGWEVFLDDDTLIFVSFSNGSKSGLYSVAGLGMTATFAQIEAGNDPTDSFVAQSSWNLDPADGTKTLPSLDLSKGNVYQIEFQWSGFGRIMFYIEDSVSGDLIPIHRVEYSNSNTLPSMLYPDMPITFDVYNGTAGDDITFYSASIAGFATGKINPFLGHKMSVLGDGEGVSVNGSGGNYVNVCTIRNNEYFKSVRNRQEQYILSLGLEWDGSNSAQMKVFKNCIFDTTNSMSWSSVDSDSAISVSTANEDITTVGELLASYGVGKSSVLDIDFSKFEYCLEPGAELTIAVRMVGSSSSTGDVSGSFLWVEYH